MAVAELVTVTNLEHLAVLVEAAEILVGQELPELLIKEHQVQTHLRFSTEAVEAVQDKVDKEEMVEAGYLIHFAQVLMLKFVQEVVAVQEVLLLVLVALAVAELVVVVQVTLSLVL